MCWEIHSFAICPIPADKTEAELPIIAEAVLVLENVVKYAHYAVVIIMIILL